MQIKDYFKGVAKALLSPVVKSLYNGFPNYMVGLQMLGDRTFTTAVSGTKAYGNKIFYSATNILVGKLIEVPIVFTDEKIGTQSKINRLYSKSITNEERRLLRKAALNSDNQSAKSLNDLFHKKPNDYQTGIEMMEDFWHNYSFGDAYLFFEPTSDLSRDKRPIAIHSLPRYRVNPIMSNDRFDKISHYEFTCFNGETIRIEKDRVLHLKHWNPNLDDLRGYGVDLAASADISLNNANNAMQGSAFVNGGRSTLISSDVVHTSDGDRIEKMTAEQMLELKKTIKKDMQGVSNYRKMHFTNGHVVVQNIGDTLVENDALKAEDYQWKGIYTIVGVPWALSPAATSVSENSIIQGYKSFVTNKIIAELRKFDQKLYRLISQWYNGIACYHDVTEFSELAPDLKLMKDVYGSPLCTVDEVRAVFNHDEIGGEQGKVILVPSGLIPLSDVINSGDVNDSGITSL